MFDKRLLAMVAEAKKYIAGTVVFKWIALLANVVAMVCLGLFLQGILAQANVIALDPSLPLGGFAAESPQLICVMAIAIIVRMACTVGASNMGTEASGMAKRKIRAAVYDKLLRLGPSYVEQIPSSQAVQIGVEGVEQLEVYFGAYIPQFFYAMIAPITLFVCLAWLSLPAAIVLLVCVPLIPGSIMMFQKLAKKVMRRYWGSYLDLGGNFLENIQGLTTLKIYQADEAQHTQMNEHAESFRKATMNVLRLQLNSITIMDILAYGGAAVGIVIVLWQFLTGSISFAAAFAIAFLCADFFLPMRMLGSLFHTAMNGMSAADKMFDLLALPEAPETGYVLDGRPVSIELRGVGYSYDGERQVLDGVDFAVEPGQFVGIVGESGSGKSTLAGILAGRNARFTGEVLVGGAPVAEVDRASLMRTITTVSYNSVLFKGTVRSNLLIARPDATDADLQYALEACRVWDFVQAGGGLDMPIAEGAANLSGGQRQRIALARGMLHDSPVYVFDEASSSIDAESEAAVLAAIAGLVGRGKTVIMISHRLSCVKDADAIYVMQAGRVVEKGPHAELMAAQGAYERLYSQQAELERFAAAGAGASASGVAVATASAADVQSEADAAVRIPEPSSRQASDQRKRMSHTRVMLRMITLVKPLAGYMTLAVVLGVLGFCAAILITVLGAWSLASAAVAKELAFALMAVLIVVCAVLRGPLHYGEQICNHFIAFKLLALVRDRVFAALRRLAPAKLEGRDKGDLLSLVTSDIELLEVFYAHTISPIIIAIVMAVGVLVALALQSPLVALLALVGYACIAIILPLAASKASGTLGRQSRDSIGAMNAFVLESLRGLYETIQFADEGKRASALKRRMLDLHQVEKRLKQRTAWSQAATDALVLLVDLALVLLASSLCLAGTITPVQMVFCQALVMSSFGPFIAVANLGTTLQSTLASGERVLELMDEEPQTADVLDGATLVGFDSCAVDQVDFSYGAEPVLSNVSLTIEPGSVVRIAGKSGSGKSTLCKLLMRFWDPTAGSISINGEDLCGTTTKSLRDTQSFMTQETHLFFGTLASNLRIARPDATDEQVMAACEKAAIDELVRRLPKGLDTPVGELGDTLSGGERQRIGLARVFLHDAPLVLLDEPTSNLDSLSEAAVLKALAAQRGTTTYVLVSHRESTASLADVTFTVDRGRIS